MRRQTGFTELVLLFIRGQKVLLDRNLAVLYGVETKVLKQAVKRNTMNSSALSLMQSGK
jgi:hypothetical protein